MLESENTTRTTRTMPRWLQLLIAVTAIVAIAACGAVAYASIQVANAAESSAPANAEINAYLEDLARRETPVVSSAPEVAANDTENTVPTACSGWDNSAGATNELKPGQSARGDVTVEGVAYYDSGVGEGTTIINLTDHNLSVYAQWGSGCENTTDLMYLVNKDLVNGCGSACVHVRIDTFTGDNKVEEVFYSDMIKK